MKKAAFALVLAIALIFTASCNNPKQNTGEISFTEVTLYEDFSCLIKATDISENSNGEMVLKFFIENKVNNLLYTVSINSFSVNGASCNPPFIASTKGKSTVNQELVISKNLFHGEDIGTPSDIELSFELDMEGASLITPSVHIYPFGEAEASKFTRTITRATTTTL